MADTKSMGFMKPIGGGDPVPLRKPEIVVGRRASCDIRLDFENVSGRHCALTYNGGTWHIRDLGSTNGTKVNGAKVERQQGLMPDDEIAIASHLFTLDYEPSGAIAESQQVLEEETGHAKRTSLMELAGIEGEDRARSPSSSARPASSSFAPRPVAEDLSGSKGVTIDLGEDEDEFGSTLPLPDEDEFLRLIEEDLNGKSNAPNSTAPKP